MAKKLNFFDGASSSTTPTLGNIVASNLIQYANDAAYEAAEQGSPTEGNIYYNTTDNVIRYYNGTSWISIVDESTAQTITNKSIDGLNNTITNVDGDEVIVSPSGNLTSTDAQAAFEEHQTDIDGHETRITTNEGDITNLEQLSGESGASAHAPFSGSTIPDSSSTRGALQALETEVETKEDSANKGVSNGYASLDAGGKVPSSQLPSSVMEYKGLFDPGTATFTDAGGDAGDVYQASAAGSYDAGSGSITYAIGDWAVHNGTIFEKSLNSDAVSSVNGYTGVVVLDTDDVAEGSTNEYYTNAKADARIAAASIDDLSDVDTSTVAPTDTQVLTWVNANSAWEPKDAAVGTGNDWVYTTITATGSTPTYGEYAFVTSGTGNYNIVLPTAVGQAGKRMGFQRDDSAIFNSNLIPNGGETINGATSYNLRGVSSSIVLISDGSNWRIENEHANFFVFARSNAGVAVPASTNTTLKFEIEVTDTHNVHNTSTGVTTVPFDGRYSIDAAIWYNASSTLTTSQGVQLRILINGTRMKNKFVRGVGVSGVYSVENSLTLDLLSADQIKIEVWSESAGAMSVDNTQNVLSIVRVS